MRRPLVVIVSGPPGAGKTTLGRAVAQEVGLPFFYKDGLKETLFDALGWSDRAWSRRVGAASFALLKHIMTAQLVAGQSFVVEANFRATYDTATFQALQARYPFEPLQIYCTAEDATLLRRFLARAATDERHPGHVELANVAEWREMLSTNQFEPLALDGAVLRVDTNDFTQVDLALLVGAVSAAVSDLRNEPTE